MKSSFVGIVILLLGLQSFSAIGQERELNPQETVQLIEAAYEILGPQMGCVLYEDAAVLTLANRQLEYQRFHDAFVGDMDKNLQLHALGEKMGLFFFLKDGSFSIASKPAIEAYAGSEDAEWLAPFSSEDNPLEWCNEVFYQLPESFGQVMPSFMEGLRGGVPTSILESEPAVFTRTTQRGPLLEVSVFLPQRFYNSSHQFQTLPQHAASKELSDWLSTRRAFLEDFYSIPSVRKRLIDDQSFLEARQNLDEALSLGFQSEAWWGNEELETLETVQYTYVGDEITLWQEKLLNTHYQEWVAQLEAGVHPSQWLENFNRWSFESGVDIPLNMGVLGTWMWQGAYRETPARAAIYEAAQKAFPEYYEYRSKSELQDWLEAGYSKHQASEIMPLFGHPEFKAYFETLADKTKEELREDLKKAMSDEAVRELLSSPPYSMSE